MQKQKLSMVRQKHKISLFRRRFIFSFILELNDEDAAAECSEHVYEPGLAHDDSWKTDFMVDTPRANEQIPCSFFPFYLGINACDVVPFFVPLFDVFRAQKFTSAVNRETRTATTAAVHPRP